MALWLTSLTLQHDYRDGTESTKSKKDKKKKKKKESDDEAGADKASAETAKPSDETTVRQRKGAEVVSSPAEPEVEQEEPETKT